RYGRSAGHGRAKWSVFSFGQKLPHWVWKGLSPAARDGNAWAQGGAAKLFQFQMDKEEAAGLGGPAACIKEEKAATLLTAFVRQ
ncbi:hypothetical protein, partial [Desulfobaculum sp.]